MPRRSVRTLVVGLAGLLPGELCLRGFRLARLRQRERAAAIDLGGLDQALVLEHLEVRVDRPGTRAPQAPAHLLEPAHDLVAVGRPVAQGGEYGRTDGAAGHAPSAAPAATPAAPATSPAAHASPGEGVVVLVVVAMVVAMSTVVIVASVVFVLVCHW